jgi:hypothetical protein
VLVADKIWNAAKNPLEARKWFSEGQSVTGYLELPDRVFVRPCALLYHRYGAPHFSERLEISEKDDAICKISDIDGRFHVPDEAMLGDRQECVGSLPVEVL